MNRNSHGFARYRPTSGFARYRLVLGFAPVLIVVILAISLGTVYLLSKKLPQSSAPPSTGQASQSQKLDMLNITLEIKAPFSVSSITINESGNLTYKAEDRSKNPDVEILESKTISQKQYQELETEMFENNFLEMESTSYDPENDPTDQSTYILTVRTLPADAELRTRAYPGVYSVSCPEFKCEPGFLEIKDKMINLWGKEILEVGI